MERIVIDERNALRKIDFGDTDLIVKWRNSSFVKENFLFRTDFTNKMHENWMRSKVLTGNVVQFIIEVDGNPIGSVYLRDIDNINHSAEYGIFIGEKEYLGKGIGSLAGKALLNYAFTELKLHKVFLRVLRTNERAIRSYKNCGFEIEGVSKDMVLLNSKYKDIVFMSVINNE